MCLFKYSRVVFLFSFFFFFFFFLPNSIGFVNNNARDQFRVVRIFARNYKTKNIANISFATRSILSRDLRVICLPSKSHFFFRSRVGGGNITCTLYLLLYTLYLIPHTPYFTLHTAYRVIYDPFGYLLFSSFSKRFDWLEIVTRERSQNIPS